MLPMAFGKYFRHERQASAFCFKGTVAIFVGFCVLAVWMTNSSSPVPAEMKSFTAITKPKYETTEKVNVSLTFEDNPGDLPDDAIKGDDGEPEKTIGTEQKPGLRETSDENEAKTSDENEDNSTVRNGGNTSDGNEEKAFDGDEIKRSDRNEEKTSDKNEAKTSDGNEEKTSDADEDKTSIGNEEKTLDENAGKISDGNEETSDENDEKTSDENEEKTSDGNEEKTSDENEGKTSVGNEERTSDENAEKTSDGNEEKTSDENEDKTSVGNEGNSSDESEEKPTVGDEKASTEGIISNEEKPLEKDSEKVIVSEGNEKMAETGVNKAEDQAKVEAENKTEPKKDEYNGEGGNGKDEVKVEGQKTESGEVGNDGKQEARTEERVEDSKLPESFPNEGQFELLKENTVEPRNWETQAAESKEEKERQEMSSVSHSKDDKETFQSQGKIAEESSTKEQSNEIIWQLCNVTAGADYIPCLDNEEAIRQLQSTKHYEHRERHCPKDPPTCLVPLPKGYRWPTRWPTSRDMIWYSNVPHTKLAMVKGHQNWVKESGKYLTFPGGGTQFKNGALHYIDFIEETVPDIAWGKHTRVILDVGCGVASFGGFLFEKQVLAMSMAPKDEHEAQVQFALERGIPAILAVMGTQRLPFPSAVFDIVHCARCRVPWHVDGGKFLLEINRLLRPGGYFVWSATPIYRSGEADVEIWNEMSWLTSSICWSLVAKEADPVNEISVAIYQKPTSNTCYESRRQNEPPLCEEGDDPNAAWYVPLKTCLHRVPTSDLEHGTEWPEEWPQRLEKVPSWLDNNLHVAFTSDTEYWKQIVRQSYLTGLRIDWSGVRNIMDMKSIYGGFAAALASQQVWVMNVVPIDAPNTLPIIYERGLFGIYHDWCESFNTYPRTYDLLHADHLFSGLKKRCTLVSVMTEVDRSLRPGGSIIFRDKVETLNELETIVKSLHWQIRMRHSQQQEGILCAQKRKWRPQLAS